jgi:hypothetical protein
MQRSTTRDCGRGEATMRSSGENHALSKEERRRVLSKLSKLSKEERRGLRRLAKRGRAGATAREIGDGEAAGLSVGATLVKYELATVTRTNRFVLEKHAGKRVPGVIAWDD